MPKFYQQLAASELTPERVSELCRFDLNAHFAIYVAGWSNVIYGQGLHSLLGVPKGQFGRRERVTDYIASYFSDYQLGRALVAVQKWLRNGSPGLRAIFEQEIEALIPDRSLCSLLIGIDTISLAKASLVTLGRLAAIEEREG